MQIKLRNGRSLGDGQKAYIIAEIGINHNGSLQIAKDLIKKTSILEIDAVKFQKRSLDKLYIRSFLDQSYLHSNSFGETYGDHKNNLEFTDEQFFELKEFADSLNVDFLVSGFDFDSFDFIENELDVLFHKIPSPYVTHYPLLEKVAGFGKPYVLSTGMHTYEEVRKAVDFVKKINDQIILMQCTSLYPCENSQINLNVLKTYRNELHSLVGYSSHDKGIILPVVAVALGACMVEKHFTFDRTAKGQDHAGSVEGRGLELIRNYILATQEGLGDGVKVMLQEEKKARIKYGISVVSKDSIKKGSVLTKDMLTYKIPGNGMATMEIDMIIGKKAKKDLDSDVLINENDFE